MSSKATMGAHDSESRMKAALARSSSALASRRRSASTMAMLPQLTCAQRSTGIRVKGGHRQLARLSVRVQVTHGSTSIQHGQLPPTVVQSRESTGDQACGHAGSPAGLGCAPCGTGRGQHQRCSQGAHERRWSTSLPSPVDTTSFLSVAWRSVFAAFKATPQQGFTLIQMLEDR